MKEQEAIQIISSELAFEPIIRDKEALKLALKALEEVQKYRAIGTVKECKIAVNKGQKMKLNPIKAGTFDYKGACPICDNRILLVENYCSQCGQRVAKK